MFTMTWPFFCVYVHMPSIVTLLWKDSATMATSKCFFPSMSFYMLIKGNFFCVDTLLHWLKEYEFSPVLSFYMCIKFKIPCESFSTMATPKWLFLCMFFQMSIKITFLWGSYQQLLHWCVLPCLCVLLNVLKDHFAVRKFFSELFFTCIYSQLFSKIIYLLECQTTMVTLKCSFCMYLHRVKAL